MIKKLFNPLRSLMSRLATALDIRDFFVFGGLALLGYGLWLLRPWLGFAASGFLLMLIGYLLKDKEGK